MTAESIFQTIIAEYQKLIDRSGLAPPRVDMNETTAKLISQATAQDMATSKPTRLLGVPVYYDEDLPDGVIEWRYRTTLKDRYVD